MSIVLDESNRSRAFTAVGSAEGVADNLWSEWRVNRSPGVAEPTDPIVTQWIKDYLDGVRASVSRILDRDLTVVTGADALAGFWASHAIDREKPSALANLARLVFIMSREIEIAHSTDDRRTVPVVNFEASRLRFPNLKRSREARADRTLSNAGDLEDQMAEAARVLPAGCQLVVVDDRLQSGGTLSAVNAAARAHALLPQAIIVAHSELPASDAQRLLPNVALYAHVYDYATADEKRDWQVRHQRGDVRLPLSEELHDVISVSPASGEAIVNRYMDAFPQLKLVYMYLKHAFMDLAGRPIEHSREPSRDVADLVGLEALKTLGVEIRDENAFLGYFVSRVGEFRRARLGLYAAEGGSYDTLKRCQERELKARWGANDIDLLFSRRHGSLALREHPEFNTDTPDKRRFGAFFPFPHRDSLAINRELRDRGTLAWAQYSYDELTRSIELVDKWEQRFGPLHPLAVPHLGAPTVQRFMQRKEKVGVLDQLSCLRQVLGEQIAAEEIRPLIA